MSPLHLAAWSGNVEVARLLVETGAHINAGSDNGDTPLILACQHGNSDVVCEKITVFTCVDVLGKFYPWFKFISLVKYYYSRI